MAPNIQYYHTCNACIATAPLFNEWRYEPVFSPSENTDHIFTVSELLPVSWYGQNVCIDQLLNSVSGVYQKVPRNITNWARFNFNVEKFVCHRFGLRFRLTIRDRRKHPKCVRDFVFHKLRHTVNKRKNYYRIVHVVGQWKVEFSTPHKTNDIHFKEFIINMPNKCVQISWLQLQNQ